MDFHLWSLEETIHSLKSKTISATELVGFYLARILQHNATLHAYITVSELALQDAKRVDEIRAKYPNALGPLAGIPIYIKDLFDTPFMATTYGGRHFGHHIPDKAATIVQKL